MTIRFASFLTAMAAMTSCVQAQQSNRVLVYNSGGSGGGYEADGMQYCWQHAGFTNADGSPLGQDGNGNLVRNGQVVGTALRDNGQLVGWRNNATSTSVIDLTGAGTLRFAWQHVAAGGRLDIYKHGTGTGGGILRLDGGRFYSGVGQGTYAPGVHTGDHPPYPLAGRQGANISVNIIACGSTASGGDVERSVADSFRNVPGCTAATGFEETSRSQLSVGFTAKEEYPEGVTTSDVEDALNKLYRERTHRPKDDTTTYSSHVQGMEYPDRIAWLRDNLGSVQVTKNGVTTTIHVNWSIEQAEPVQGSASLPHAPVFLAHPGPTDQITHATNSGIASSVRMLAMVDSDSAPDRELLSFQAYSVPPAEPPLSLLFASLIYKLTAEDGWLEHLDALATVQLTSVVPSNTVHLYTLAGGVWQPVTEGETFNAATNTLSANFSIGGLDRSQGYYLVALTSVPAPGALAVLMLAGAIAGARRRRDAGTDPTGQR